MGDRGGDWLPVLFLTGHVAQVDDVTWLADDCIRYLSPEIVLAYKARLRGPKDEPDFDATLPVLNLKQREWLREALAVVTPGHHWTGAARLGGWHRVAHEVTKLLDLERFGQHRLDAELLGGELMCSGPATHDEHA